MTTNEADLEQVFFEAFPDEFLRNLIRLLGHSYKAAHDKCRAEYPYSEAHDLRPHLRRADIERNVRDLTTRYAEIEADAEPNPRKTSFYTLVSSNRIVLTLSAVAHPKILVRRAHFRDTYAQTSQLHLFKKRQEPPPGAKIYALLLHGPDRKDPSRPAFMQVAFPDKKLTRYLYAIDLFARYSALVNSLWPVQNAKQPPTVDPQMQPRKDAKLRADQVRRKVAGDEKKDMTG